MLQIVLARIPLDSATPGERLSKFGRATRKFTEEDDWPLHGELFIGGAVDGVRSEVTRGEVVGERFHGVRFRAAG